LRRRDSGPAALDEDLTGQFLAARRADGYAALRSARALAPLLGHLRGLGVAPPPRMPVLQMPADRLAMRFGEYLARERGLAGDDCRERCPCQSAVAVAMNSARPGLPDASNRCR
jgi:hypothetical protein